MNMVEVKVKGEQRTEWRIELEAVCPNCDAIVKGLKPKDRIFPKSGRVCPNCGFRVDRVYFD